MEFSKKPLLSIVTVNYGSAEKVMNLYASLVTNPPSCLWEFIVVDNHSVNNDFQKLNTFFDQKKNAHVVPLSENIGFGRGNDEGLRFAQGDIIAFTNPDVEVSADCFNLLLQELKNEKTGIAVPVLKSFQGTVLESTWNFPNPWRLFQKRLLNTRPQAMIPDSATPVPWAQGSFLVLKKSLYEKLGGFDHRFFLFFEDTDICRKCWNAGFRVVQIPKAIAFHEEKRLSGHDIFSSLRRKTFWIHVGSMMKYFWKYRGKKFPKIF